MNREIRIGGVRIQTWMKFFCKIVLAIGLVIGFSIIVALVCENTVGRFDCSRTWRDSGMRHRFDWWAGCMIEPQSNKWIPADNYREVP